MSPFFFPADNTVKTMAVNASQGGMRMWPSPKVAAWLYDWSNIGLIIGLVLGVVSTVLLVWMGNIKEEYLNLELARSRERTASLEKQSDESKTAIAKADADAAASLAVAKQAEANLAGANSRAEEAKAISAQANARAAEANERVLKAGKEVAKLQTEAAEARRSLAETEIRLSEVKIRQTPRNLRIPSDMVLSILKNAPPGKAIILYQQADAESALFATGLRLRLGDAGWQILGFKAIPSSIVYGAGNEDIHFVMKDLVNGLQSDSVQVLVKVFNAAAITWGGFGDPKLPDDTPRIIIHPKP